MYDLRCTNYDSVSCCPEFYPLFIITPLEDPLDEHTGGVDMIGIQAAYRQQFLYFSDGDPAGHSHGLVEVVGYIPVNQVAAGISLPGFNN